MPTSITGHHAEAGLTYDDDGSLTIDGTWHYTYDAENRLTSMTRKDASQSLTFVYDYLGRRASKTVTGTGAKTVLYVWSGWRLAAELDGSKNLAKSYLWGADFSNGMGAAGGAGGLLAVRQGGTNYYPVYDNHGNITGYLNEWGGMAATYEYNAFGQLLNSSGSADAFTFGYATQTTDWETGLVYYGLRYYSPKHGRFINRDPIEEAGGLNLYAFVGNQAGNAWDVLGLSDVILDPYIVTERRWTAEDEEWYKSLRRAGWTEEQIWWEFDQLDWVITNTQNQEKKPSEPPAPKRADVGPCDHIKKYLQALHAKMIFVSGVSADLGREALINMNEKYKADLAMMRTWSLGLTGFLPSVGDADVFIDGLVGPSVAMAQIYNSEGGSDVALNVVGGIGGPAKVFTGALDAVTKTSQARSLNILVGRANLLIASVSFSMDLYGGLSEADRVAFEIHNNMMETLKNDVEFDSLRRKHEEGVVGLNNCIEREYGR